jgi:hypothetical protein
MMNSKEPWEYFTCECSSFDHTLRAEYDEIENELWFSIHLDYYQPFYIRVWNALRYVLGYRCRQGHFDCFILRNYDKSRMLNLISQIKEQS